MNHRRRHLLASFPLTAAGSALLTMPAFAHFRAVPPHSDWVNASTLLRTRCLDISVEAYDNAVAYPVFARERNSGHVGGASGQAYRLRLRNLGNSRLLVVVSVDGLNVLTGKEAHPSQGGYILNPYGETTIDGWRKSLSEVAKFVFSAPAESYASRTGQSTNVGVIGFAVFEEKGSPPPVIGGAPDKRGSAAEGLQLKAAVPSTLGASPSLGTGHGDRDFSRVSQSSFDRATVSPIEVVRLDYDSLQRLEAQGIALRPAPAPRNPFPATGFVPDPPAKR